MCKGLQLGLEIGRDAPVLTVSNPCTGAKIVRVELHDEHARRLLSIAKKWLGFEEDRHDGD